MNLPEAKRAPNRGNVTNPQLEYEHRCRVGSFEVYFCKDGLIYARNTDKNAVHDLELAKEYNATIERVVGPTAHRPMVIDLTVPLSLTIEAQNYYTSPEGGTNIKAVAFVTPSFLSRVIGNLLLGAKPAALPLKLFDKPEYAIHWLKQFPAE